jgi:hypothetical protein
MVVVRETLLLRRCSKVVLHLIGHHCIIAYGYVQGVEQGQFHITYDFIGNVFRASSRGSSPGNSGLIDQIYNSIGAVSPENFVSESIYCCLSVFSIDWSALLENGC